jgi:hypothetical protein
MMMNAPATIDWEQLDELSLEVIENE